MKLNSLKCICVIALSFLFARGLYADAPAHLQWMSFYSAEIGDPFMQGADDIEGAANLYAVCWDLNYASDAAKKGLAQFIDLGNLLYFGGWQEDQSLGHIRKTIRTDYQQCWKAFRDLIDPVVTNGTVRGFSLGDEIVWWGVDMSGFAAIADMVKSTYPSAIVYYGEGSPIVMTNKNYFEEMVSYFVPSSIDWFAINHYIADVTVVRDYYNSYIYPLLDSSQKVMILPKAYGDNTLHSDESFIDELLYQANAYYDWAKDDPNVIGLTPWHWANLKSTGAQSLGIVGMPKLKARYKDIADEIMANNPPVVKPGITSFVQGFDIFGNNEVLPSIYAAVPFGPNEAAGTMPVAPNNLNVCFSTAKAASGTTSIDMKNTDASFRYTWGLLNRVHYRMPDTYPVRHFEFKIWIDDESTIDLLIEPLRGDMAPFTMYISSAGLTFSDEYQTDVFVASMADFTDDAWNKVSVTMDLREENTSLMIKVNDLLQYTGAVYTSVSRQMAMFTSLKFTGGSCYLDDIGLWGETIDDSPQGNLIDPSIPFGKDENTLALWHMDENSGDVTYGENLYAYNAWPTDINAATWSTVSDPNFGSCLSFNGVIGSSGLRMPFSSGFEGLSVHNTDSTVECRVKLDAYPGPAQNWRSVLVMCGTSASINAWGIEIDDDGKLFYHFVDSTEDGRNWLKVRGNTPLQIGQWHHIAATRELTPRNDGLLVDVTIKLYIDGKLDKAQEFTALHGLFQSWSVMCFGSQTVELRDPLVGKLDEIRISNVIRYGLACESGQYLPGDINEDCYVDFEDVAEFVSNWLLNY